MLKALSTLVRGHVGGPLNRFQAETSKIKIMVRVVGKALVAMTAVFSGFQVAQAKEKKE